jgi:hypothetical protein
MKRTAASGDGRTGLRSAIPRGRHSGSAKKPLVRVPELFDPCRALLRAIRSCFCAPTRPDPITPPRPYLPSSDILSSSVVPYARTTRLRFDRANGLAFTNTFQFYPWMLDKQFEDMILINPAQVHANLLDEFKGQSFPEQSQASVMWNDIDVPLARELLNRWIDRFSGNPVAWKKRPSSVPSIWPMRPGAFRRSPHQSSMIPDARLLYGSARMKSSLIRAVRANPTLAPSPGFWKA